MINKLTKLATHLDSIGYRVEASYLDSIIRRFANENDEAEEKAMLEAGGDFDWSGPSVEDRLNPSLMDAFSKQLNDSYTWEQLGESLSSEELEAAITGLGVHINKENSEGELN